MPSRMFLILSPLKAAAASARFLSCNWNYEPQVSRDLSNHHKRTYKQDAVLDRAINFEFEDVHIALLSKAVSTIESLVLLITVSVNVANAREGAKGSPPQGPDSTTGRRE
jgi:hypothetical protein